MHEPDEVTDLSDVDGSGTAERYTSLLGRVAARMQAHKERSYDLLRLCPGQQVLEVGAGTGEDATALALRVAPGGRVVAIDKSRDLLRDARERVKDRELAIEFRRGDAHRLDLPDSAFDACRAERVFQHLADPRTALAEMARVTRAGGRVLVIDADYESLVLDASDRQVTRCIVRRRAEAAPQGRVGRQLPRLFRETGLEVEVIEGLCFVCTEHDLAMEIFELAKVAEGAVQDGELARERVEAWRAELNERGRQGSFFLASHGFLVAGHKPA